MKRTERVTSLFRWVLYWLATLSTSFQDARKLRQHLHFYSEMCHHNAPPQSVCQAVIKRAYRRLRKLWWLSFSVRISAICFPREYPLHIKREYKNGDMQQSVERWNSARCSCIVAQFIKAAGIATPHFNVLKILSFSAEPLNKNNKGYMCNIEVLTD